MNLQEEFYYRIDNDKGFDNKKLGDDLISIAKKHLSKQLLLHNVSQQRELLGRFLKYYNQSELTVSDDIDIDLFLNDNKPT